MANLPDENMEQQYTDGNSDLDLTEYGQFNQRPEYRNKNNKEKSKSSVGQKIEKGARIVKGGAKVAGTTAQATGKTLQATGKGTELAGKGVQLAGKGVGLAGNAIGSGLQAAGKGIASIPVPVVAQVIGAGVAGIGTGAKVAGKAAGSAMNATGKAIEHTGRTVNKAGSTVNKVGKNIKQKGKSMGAIGSINTRINKNLAMKFGPIGVMNQARQVAQGIALTAINKDQDISRKINTIAKLASYGMYKACWYYMIPSYGLTYFGLLWHFCAKYIAGSRKYCHFVSTTDESVILKIKEDKDTFSPLEMIKFAVIGMLLLVILAALFYIITLFIETINNPVKSLIHFVITGFSID